MKKNSKFRLACPNWNFSLESQLYIDDNDIECIEEWKWVKNHKWLYEISNIGRLKTHNWRGVGRTMIVTPKMDADGYLWYRMSKNNKKTMLKVHRIVALHFIPNPKKLPEVNHKNGVKLNNKPSNLEWSTHADNMAHFGKHIYKKGQWGGFNNARSIMSKKDVTDIRNGVYDNLTTSQLSRKLGVNWCTIDRIRKGISYTGIKQKDGCGIHPKWAKDKK